MYAFSDVMWMDLLMTKSIIKVKTITVSPKVGLLPLGINPLPRYMPQGVYLTFGDTQSCILIDAYEVE